MKSAVISSCDVVHSSGVSCMSAARWCYGKCDRAAAGKCTIWEAGDCTATLPTCLRHIKIQCTDAEYRAAVQLLQDAGFQIKERR